MTTRALRVLNLLLVLVLLFPGPALATPYPDFTVKDLTLTKASVPGIRPSSVSSPRPVTPQVVFSKSASRETGQVGDIITYTLVVRNSGNVALRDVVLIDTLPRGMSFLGGTTGKYDPISHTIEWRWPEVPARATNTLVYQVRIEEGAPAVLVNRAHLQVASPAQAHQASASVYVLQAADVSFSPARGGMLRTPDGRITVTFGPGALPPGMGSVRARVKQRNIHRLATGQAGMAMTFDLSMQDEKGTAIVRFQKPVTVTLNLDGLANWASRPAFLRPWAGYFNEARGAWEPVRVVHVDEARGEITFVTDHFSTFGAGTAGSTEGGWQLQFNDTRVARFSGALTWALPLGLPPGRQGITPPFQLTYNSRRVDGILTWAQSDGVGFGWSLDVGEIMWRNVRRCWDGAHYYMCWDDVPLLVLNGEALKLVPESAMPQNVQYLGHNGTYRYRTEDDRLWRITWYSGTEMGYWEVITRDGVKYRFGTTGDSRQVARGWIGGWTGSAWLAYQATVRWRLKEIVYPTGMTITFYYSEQTYNDQCTIWKNEGQIGANETCPNGDDGNHERASYLTTITYSGTRVRVIWGRRWNGNGPNDGIGAQAYRWDFASSGQLVLFWQTDAVQKVIVERHRADGGWDTVREWRFTYGTFVPADEPNKRLRVLSQVQAWGTDGTAWYSLPAWTFGYTGYNNKEGRNDGQGTDWEKAQFNYPRLTSLNNGYGGQITVAYGTPDSGWDHAANWRVESQEVHDGLGGGWKDVYLYSADSQGRCYLETEDATTCKWPSQFSNGKTGGDFLGYREVTVERRELSGTVMRKGWAQFALPPDDWLLRGRLKVEKVEDATSTPLQVITNTWTISATIKEGNTVKAGFIALQEKQVEQDGQVARTVFAYDAYGNLIRQQEYSGSATVENRTHIWAYHPNTSAWLVSYPAQYFLYRGIQGSTPNTADLMVEERYYYDNASSYTTPPTKGLRTKVRRGKDGWGWVETRATYDAWGNVASVTDPLGRTTTYTYDSYYHLYRIQETNPLNHTTTYEYYGINESDPGIGSGYTGLLKRVTDPNGAAVLHTYDAFGRTVAIVRPYDSLTYPTVQYTYADTVFPFRIQVDQREVSGQAGVITTYRFYDGLGRLVETKAELPGGQQSVSQQTYNALGLTARQYMPFSVSASASYVSENTTRPHTEYTYDALGRVTRVTHPDGKQVVTAYQGWKKGVLDENGHQRIYEYDGFGRLEKVHLYTGTYTGVTWSATPYATTTYTYNVQDLLVQVTGPDGAVTTMQYDPLGRKVQMSDPDMGTWTYAYDAAGNLKRQTDARGRLLCYSYDALNRLRYVHEDTDGTPDCAGTLSWLATHEYDAYDSSNGQYGRGRRTELRGPFGRRRWRYDLRGRVTQETLEINGLDPFTTQWTYDAADRVRTMTYPDGETVTYTYDAAGQPYSLSSALGTYVQSTTYDAAGRVTQRVLGANTIQQTFTYYPWTTASGRGRLKEIKAGKIPNTTDLQALTYTYDAVGNIKTIVDARNSNQKQCFSYDELDRLVHAYTGNSTCTAYSSTGNGPYELQFTYAPNGNLTQWKQVHPTWQVRNYTYGASKPHAVTQVGSDTFAYDANGNMTSRHVGSGTYTLSYDAQNRLVSVSGGASATFTYDGDGNKVKVVEGGKTKIFVGPWYEKVGSVVWKYYIIGGQRVAYREGGTLYFILPDHLGSTVTLANGNGTSSGRLWYYPYGDVRPGSGSVSLAYRFTGQRWDGVIKLYDYNARYYDSAIGRFIQPDTIVPNPGNPQDLNRYTYVRNNPVRYADPTGMYLCEDAHGSCDASTAWGMTTIIEVEEQYGVKVTGTWRYTEARILRTAFERMQAGVAAQLQVSGEEARSLLARALAGGTITRGSHDSPMYLLGILAVVTTTGDLGSRPMANTFAPYYTIGETGFVALPKVKQPTVFLWDETFDFGISLAIGTIIHETGHLLDYITSSAPPDLLAGSPTSRSLFERVGYKNAPTEYALASPWELFAETWVAYVNETLKATTQSEHIMFFNHLLQHWR